ncbi:MAG: efflux RND transporter periplasmic adaptor subunit [Bacteroidales bacterium]|nr:efflux RND transporter periplasmic adaptor subunit [Bacteroidales bacterium]
MNKFKILTAFAFSVILLTSCGSKPKETEAKEVEVLPENIVELSADQFKVAGIVYGSIEQKTLSNTVKANGIITVSPQNLASICAPLGGFIRNTDLVVGSPVRKGQTLAIIENPEFIELQQNYLEAKSKLEFAEGEYNRHKELFKDDVYSAQNFQEVTSNYKSLKTQVNALAQKLEMVGINPSKLQEDNISRNVSLPSPISGYVKVVNVNIGKFVAPTDVIFEIVNTDRLTIELTLFEKDINKVNIGQKLRFSMLDGETQYTASITHVGRSIDADKTVKVYASIGENSASILPGMYVNSWIETSSNSLATLPTEAIIQFDEKEYIFVFEKDKEENGKPFTEFKMVEVKKGLSDGGYTEVILPKEFDLAIIKVVVKGAYNLMAAKKNAGEMSCG